MLCCVQVLAADAQADERVWSDLSAEAAAVQREVGEMIWDELVADTAHVLSVLEEQLAAGGK